MYKQNGQAIAFSVSDYQFKWLKVTCIGVVLWMSLQMVQNAKCMLISNLICIDCCFACSVFNAHCPNDNINCVSGFARPQWLKNTKWYNFALRRMRYVRFEIYG